MRAGTPYASIIIPTHDRAATLPFSLRSALAQTVEDIEVLVVGDGCTESVRQVAQEFARNDPRVRFLDLSKAPLRGAANRHRAIHEARAERIFYNDDDDLLLSHHVEVLGAGLADADVVDTPPISIGVDGRVNLGLHDSAHPVIRQMLVEESYKGVFDTHLAHRRSSYVNGRGAWIQSTDRRVVLHLLKCFATQEGIVWHTMNRITALSFHGMARFGAPGTWRAEELRAWERYVSYANAEHELHETGTHPFHAYRIFGALQAAGLLESSDFVLDWLGAQADVKRQKVCAVRDLLLGQQPDPAIAVDLLDDLLDGRLGPRLPVGEIVSRFLGVFGTAEMKMLLSGCRPRAAVDLAHLHVAVRERAFPLSVMDGVEQAIAAAPSWEQMFLVVCAVEALVKLDEFEEAWRLINGLEADNLNSFHMQHYWKLRSEVATHLGHQKQGEYAARRAAMHAGQDT